MNIEIMEEENKIKYIEEKLNALKESNEIKFWKINTNENRKYNIYVEKEYKVESILNSKTNSIRVEIFKEFEDGTIGSSSFNVTNLNKNDFETKLNDAIFICSNSKNKKFNFPNKDDEIYSDEDINYDNYYSKKFEESFNSNSLDLFFEKKLNLFRNIINSKNEELKELNLKVKLNTIEFLNSFNINGVKLSNGIDKKFKSNSFYMEFVITLIDLNSNKEFEYIVYKKINDIFYFNYESFFKESIKILLTSNSNLKISNLKGEVILSNSAASDFFNPDLTSNSVIGFALGRLKYMGISKFDIGEGIVKSKYDKLNININSTSNNSINKAFDEFGIPAKNIPLIENSKLKNFFVDLKYGSYLGLDPSGPFGNIEVGGGSLSEKELFKSIKKNSSKEIIEIVSFSSFVPDLISGDFSAEIRLGFKIDENGNKTAFKGGLFTGNIFKLLEEVQFSKEIYEGVGYRGPKYIKFINADIVGVDE